MKYFFLILLLFTLFRLNFVSCQVSQNSGIFECNLKKQARIELRIGGNERFFNKDLIPETLPIIGFNPSIHLTLPIKFKSKYYLYSKFIFGRSINNIHFNEIGVTRSRIGINGTDLYSNIYVGTGIGSHFIKHLKNNSFIRIPISLNVIYFPFVETFSEEGFSPVPFRDYFVDIENNLDDRTNFSLTPELSFEYHFSLMGCTSFSLGMYYSRSFNTTYEGEVAIQRANGEIIRESFNKPFSSFGISISYGIFRLRNK